jgi:hypothetical protein
MQRLQASFCLYETRQWALSLELNIVNGCCTIKFTHAEFALLTCPFFEYGTVNELTM